MKFFFVFGLLWFLSCLSYFVPDLGFDLVFFFVFTSIWFPVLFLAFASCVIGSRYLAAFSLYSASNTLDFLGILIFMVRWIFWKSLQKDIRVEIYLTHTSPSVTVT